MDFLKDNWKILFNAFSLLANTIIGVGFFALPYITLQTGFKIILLYFLILTTLIIIVHEIFGQISLKTPDYKRFPGFVEYHLGKKIGKISVLTTIFSLLGSILVYLIVGGEFLGDLLFKNSNFLLPSILYWLIGTIIIFLDIQIVSKVSSWSLLFLLAILFSIFLKGKTFFNLNNIPLNPKILNFKTLFLPYGPILFSLWGASIIPEIEEMILEKKYLLSKIIKSAILFSSLCYLFFIIIVLGITGKNTTPSALTGLKTFLGDKFSVLVFLFGLITTFTSYISLGLTLKKILIYDLKVKKVLSIFIIAFVPLILFLFGIKNFIAIISFLGAIILGIDGILILLIYKKLDAKKSKISLGLILIFILGIIYEFLSILK
jgi:amino acid permease